MTDPDRFEHWSLAAEAETDPDEVLAEAGRLLAAGAAAGRATVVELGGGGFHLGWHPVLGRFRVAGRAEGAPPQLPAYLAALEEARHVHAGGERPEAAIAALVTLVRETSERLG